MPRNKFLKGSIPTNKTPPELEAKVVDAYVAGWSAEMVSELFGVAPSTILSLVRRNGHETRGRAEAARGRTLLPHSEFEKTAFMYVQLEMSTAQVAKQLGIRSATVNYRLRKAGIKLRTNSEAMKINHRLHRTDEQRREWAKKRWEGVSKEERTRHSRAALAARYGKEAA